MRRASATIDALSCLSLAVLVAIGLAAVGCHAPVVAPLVVVVSPVLLLQRHDIGSWLDDDQVCVVVPATQAVYVTRQCLSMRAVRWLILETRAGDNEGSR
jgi:hypothetical protein